MIFKGFPFATALLSPSSHEDVYSRLSVVAFIPWPHLNRYRNLTMPK